MRKSLVLTLALVGLSIFGLCAAGKRIDARSNAVELKQTVLYGSPDAAKGLRVDARAHCENHLFWDTSYTFDKTPRIKTAFHFSQEAEYQPLEDTYSGMTFSFSNGIGFSGASIPDPSLYADADKPFRDVAGRTPAGEKHSEVVTLGDYYEFYPLNVDLFLPDYSYNSWNDILPSDPDYALHKRLMQCMTDYFKIPVVENHQLLIEIEKDAKGKVVSTNTRDTSGVSIDCRSVCTDEDCYFVFNSSAGGGKALDLSRIPGGAGLYRLPLQKLASGRVVPVPEKLETAYPIDGQTRVEQLAVTPDQTKLLLLTREGSACLLTILDAKTAKELQTLQLDDFSGTGGTAEIRVFDGFFVVFSGNHFAVIEKTDGGAYSLALKAALGVDWGADYAYSGRSGIAWDGERLAMSAFETNAFDPSIPCQRSDLCAFNLSVYDKSGLRFYAHYGSSLSGATPKSEDLCRPLDENELTLTWAG